MKVKAGGAIGPFRTFDEISEAVRLTTDDFYDTSLEYEIQVNRDKAPFKIIPCTICRRPIVVNTFYVLAWAKCDMSGCSGNTKERGSVGVAQAGRTEPELAANLVETLINPTFARALCPVHPDNEEHEMELKSVSHNTRYGPGEWRSDPRGGRIYVQVAAGETVMHQCTKCKAVVTYATTAQHQFRRVNEPKEVATRGANAWGDTLGIHEDDEEELA